MPLRWFAAALTLCAVGWSIAWWGTRRDLRLENHLERALALPFQPLGRPALHPDGRIFLVAGGAQLMALEPSGMLSWNKRLPGPVTPQPVLVRSDLLVLQGAGRLLGYSLGGDPRFSVDDDGEVGDLPCADEQGLIYLLDRHGGLAGFGPDGQMRFRTSLGLVRQRRLIVLPGGQLLAAGVPEQGPPLLALGEPTGLVMARRRLGAPAVGLAVSPRSGELAAVAAGTEVLVLGAGAEVVRRVALPAPARSAPLLLRDGSVFVLAEAPGAQGGLALCRAGGTCIPLGPVAEVGELNSGPVLGRDGRLHAAFHAPGRWLLPGYHGILSATPRGEVWRQALPGPVSSAGLTVSWDGSVIAVVEGERYLWKFAVRKIEEAHHPWPVPAGNPAGSSRPWPLKP